MPNEVLQPDQFQPMKEGKTSAVGWCELMALPFLQNFTFSTTFSTQHYATNAISSLIFLPLFPNTAAILGQHVLFVPSPLLIKQ